VQFFDAADAGLFDLLPKKNDDQGNPVVISFYGPQIVFSQVIIPNDYNDVAAGMQMEPASGTADITVSPLTVTGFGVGAAPERGELLQLLGVPEPSTWVMMTLGFAGLAFAGYRASRKRTMVA
jgi:PEP-CTERM motif